MVTVTIDRDRIAVRDEGKVAGLAFGAAWELAPEVAPIESQRHILLLISKWFGKRRQYDQHVCRIKVVCWKCHGGSGGRAKKEYMNSK